MAFVTEDGQLDREALKPSGYLPRAGYRMSLIEFELPEWDQINRQKDSLVGCSLTGWQDMKNAVGLTVEEEIQLLKDLRRVAREAVREIAHEIGDVEPELVTTIKPEGTQSQLPTVSSGLHYSHSPYYIRRVRNLCLRPVGQGL